MNSKPADEGAILDLRILDEICPIPGRYDDHTVRRLIGVLAREEEIRLKLIAARARDRKAAELAQAAHKLAGSCAVIGAMQMRFAAQRIERLAGEGQWDELDTRVADLPPKWKRLLAELVKHKLLPER